MAYPIVCAQCRAEVQHGKPGGRFCSAVCRSRHHREHLSAVRARLATDADAALRTGDLATLESFARRTVALLMP